ncbi:MAG: coenzyme F420-0:L-glutamate ligase [SAR202 cluster bacterium]|jgi:coenzyme F420-0:L-glutamate ligase/coenzyme F420-1:gamma-L-glutamate ligase|nr:coenzyme F420-0:L-glutamate ligase [SAR202 cluster bacterium]|tara:strand:- start:1000 stop:1797 length:798 start_codon:yes stop_codon:yes gene_type:complete
MSKYNNNNKLNKVPRIEIIGISGIPEIKYKDNLARIIVSKSIEQGTPIEENDIIIITQKIVSKSEGQIKNLINIKPSEYSIKLASKINKDPRLIELIINESKSIIRIDEKRSILITETKQGFICANAGIDNSNIPGSNNVSLLPKDPDKSANNICSDISYLINQTPISVIITDTFGRAWRKGQVNFAIGTSRIEPLLDYMNEKDSQGKILKSTNICIADELASAAELVNFKSNQIPVSIIRNYPYSISSSGAKEIIRAKNEDLFR